MHKDETDQLPDVASQSGLGGGGAVKKRQRSRVPQKAQRWFKAKQVG